MLGPSSCWVRLVLAILPSSCGSALRASPHPLLPSPYGASCITGVGLVSVLVGVEWRAARLPLGLRTREQLEVCSCGVASPLCRACTHDCMPHSEPAVWQRWARSCTPSGWKACSNAWLQAVKLTVLADLGNLATWGPLRGGVGRQACCMLTCRPSNCMPGGPLYVWSRRVLLGRVTLDMLCGDGSSVVGWAALRGLGKEGQSVLVGPGRAVRRGWLGGVGRA